MTLPVQNPRVLIVGAGAIGCVVGGQLARAGRDVTLVDQWPEHVETIRRVGLRLSGTIGEQLIPVRILHLHEAQALSELFDVAFVAVKSYDTEWATQLACRHLREPDGVVVDFQNGINDHRVARVAGKERALGCVILIGAGMYEPGHAMRTDDGTTGFKIGEHDGADTERARALAALLSDVAPTKVTTNLWGERWSKLAINCMANPVAGLSGLGTSEVRTHPVARRIAIHLAAECVLVARTLGVELETIWGVEPQGFVDAVRGTAMAETETALGRGAQSRGGGRPSMLQDVMRGRRTEIEYLNGYVVEQGRAAGVATPVNERVVELFARHGRDLRPDPRNLEPLLEATR